jgi:UDP-N-acetyl-D-galactosamine dehydrogenase
LAQRAQEFGYHPEIILAGRRLNDSMADYVASQIVKLMIKKGISVKGASLLMLGITFKENCPDVRNTKVINVIEALVDYGIVITTHDPVADPEAVLKEYGITTCTVLPSAAFDAVVLGVSHQAFLSLDFEALQKPLSILYDVKGVLGSRADGRL